MSNEIIEEKKKITKRIMKRVYDSILPYRQCNLKNPTPKEQLEGGYGYCATYVNVFKWLLSEEDIQCRTVTAISINSLTGCKTTHVIAEVEIGDKRIVYDPSTNLCFGVSFEELIAHPEIAGRVVEAHKEDRRWQLSVLINDYNGFYAFTDESFYKNIVIWTINRDKNLGGGVQIK